MKLEELELTKKRMNIVKNLELSDSDDILSYYPSRYDRLVNKSFDKWLIKERVIFEGTITSSASIYRYQRNKSIIKFSVETDTQIIDIVLFNRPWAKNMLNEDIKIVIIGTYEGKNKVSCLNYNFDDLESQLGIKAIYPLKDKITQKQVSKIVEVTYNKVIDNIHEDIPDYYRSKYKLITKKQALRCIHSPNNENELLQATRYLKYEEMLKFNLTMLLSRYENREIVKIPKMFDDKLIETLINSIEFELTIDQKTSVNEIINDLKSDKIMYRLLQGDVGSGKTIVAIIALYACVISGSQACIMAPTQILASQHYKELKKVLQDNNLKIEILSGGLKNSDKKLLLSNLQNNKIDILVGTHALFQDDVVFANLGLIIADEQHRFGVKQRKKLKEKGHNSDFLLMSATPIPRTLASSLYADMEVSTIKTKPSKRLDVKTKLIKENTFRTVLDKVETVLSDKQQIYVVCAAIDENENYKVRNVNTIYQNLKKLFNNKYQVGLIYGSMSNDDKTLIMDSFKRNEIQVLVSTTVIEVGVSVDNSTLMIIYDADRFGLSQIHQLRGRVQRGEKQGYCYLLTDSKDEKVFERLEMLEKETDGFKISMYDLKTRGAGDLLGFRQSGYSNFTIANIVDDVKILNVSREDAKEILDNQNFENKILINNIIEKNKSNIEYIN
jgi:ATP-dependent DNA helicase RecG